jgi:hypothetical protein
MYGLTRGATTVIGVVIAGFLLWLGTQILPDSGDPTSGEYWGAVGLVALAGLTMALSQLLGGWTKWGWPRVSGTVFVLGFLPALILGGWLVASVEPGNHWLGTHVRNWSDDLGIEGFVNDMRLMFPAIAFGIGLVFGFTFDTTGPRVRKRTSLATPVPATAEQRRVATDGEATTTDGVGDDRRVHIREGDAPDTQERTPEPEPAPRTREPTRH